MEIVNTLQNRKISFFISKCINIQNIQNLNSKYNKNILIENIDRLNKYITINNNNIEIYGIKDNIINTYFISNNSNIEENYLKLIRELMKKYNLDKWIINIFNNNKLILIKTIQRFEINNLKRSRKEFESDSNYQSLIDNKFKYEINDTWVSASKTRNSALNDRCIDYYNEYNITKYEDNPRKSIKKINRTPNEFLNIKFQEGKDFEDKVYNFLKNKYKDNIVMICESYLARDKNMCIKTFNEMYKGIPLIYQGILQNPENKTLGSVDLLVRDDYINDITESEYQIEKFESIFPHKHFYYAVDIKNSKLHFNVDNVTLRNNTNVKPFKFQLYVYNEALKYMQNVNTSKAFILGNSWKMERTESKKKISESSYDFSNKLGTVDFQMKDDYVTTEANDAIDWLHELKQSTDWTHKPPSNINIFPNMKNRSDEGYREIKQKSADELKDLTLIAHLTPEHRQTAFRVGIKTWDDPKLNSTILGLNAKIGEYVDSILNANRDTTTKKIFFNSLDKTDMDIFDDTRLEYFIDYETIYFNNKVWVYMLGLGYNYNNEWTYKCFILDDLNEVSERKMYNDLLEYTKQTNQKYNINYKPIYYHWTQVEPNNMEKLVSLLKLPSNDIIWYDLYKYFKDNLIIVKGALNHSLKSIGKAMFDNKLIKTIWKEDILIDNKIQIGPYNKYVQKKEIDWTNLINYNEVDCKIMYDILKVIRNIKK